MGNSKFMMKDNDFKLSIICEQFRLGKFKGVIGKLGGAFNTNVKIETSEGIFVVRILNEKNTVNHLRYVGKVLSTLRERGIPVLEPILAVNGESYINHKGKLLQVSAFVTADPFCCRESQVYASAQTLRAFHQALEQSDPGPKPSWSFYRTSAYYSDALDHLKEISDIPRNELSSIELLSETIIKRWKRAVAHLPNSILHGDWHFWNLLYMKDEVSCVMDFDFVQQGKRIHDIAYVLWAIYMLLPENALCFDRTFLQGYGELTEAEKAILPIAVARVALFFLCQSAYASNPLEKWNKHYPRQEPFIQWLFAEGAIRLDELTNETSAQAVSSLMPDVAITDVDAEHDQQ